MPIFCGFYDYLHMQLGLSEKSHRKFTFNVSTSLGGASYYFKWIVGNEGMAGMVSIFSFVMVPLMLVFPWIMKKIGSMGKMVAIFCFISVAGYVIALIANGNLALTMVGMALGNLASLPLSYYGILFITRCATYNEMIGMDRMDASSGAVANFTANLGGALGSFVSGILLTLGNYNYGEGVTSQPDSALFMVRANFALVPAILVIVCGFCAWKFAGLDKKIEEWEAKKAPKTEEA